MVVLGKPGTLSITGSLYIGVNAVAFVVEVEVAPVGAESSGREHGVGRSNMS